MTQFSGASAIMQNLRNRLPSAGVHGAGESLSSHMENVSMLSYLEPHDGVAVASFRVATMNPTAESISSGIKRLFGNEMEVVAGSMRVIENSQFFTSVSAHIKRAHVTRSVSPDGTMPNGFTSLSKNIFMEDRDSSTWKLVQAGDGKSILVRDASVETDADMEKLLASLSSAGHEYGNHSKELCAQANSVIESIETGALCVVASDEGVTLAFAIEAMGRDGSFGAVQCSGDGEYADLHASAVIRIIDSSEFINLISAPATDSVALASGGRVDVNVLVEYYRKVFGHNKDFFQQWSQRLKTSSLALG